MSEWVKPKKATESKTIWFGIAGIVIGAVMELLPVLVDAGWIPSGGWAGIVMGFGSILLRFKTGAPIARKP